ncbi:MAG: TetR/AcrR family transcriptional regulator [Myxococcaceae bacterium]|nr:TetR/AcrR family transcriptional regulator [Myxococcaceae bacterium]
MPRPHGSKNRDYDASRRALAKAVSAHLLRADGEPSTFKDLAAGAGVSQQTLKHYFGDRATLVRAAFEAIRDEASPYFDGLAERRASRAELKAALVAELRGVVAAFRRFGFGRSFGSGLSLGLGHPTLGPAFVELILEPTFQSLERRLAHLMEDGQLAARSPRTAALSLLGPLVLALLHQDQLGGVACRPLDVDALIAEHVTAFLDGSSPRPARSRGPSSS